MKLTFKQVNKMVWQDKKHRIILPTRTLSSAEQERIYLLHEYNTYLTTTGEIIILRTDENGKIVVIQVYQDIAAAVRAQFHILAQYLGTKTENGEIGQLEDIDLKLVDAHALFLVGNTENLQTTLAMSDKLSSALDDLDACRNLLKLEAAGQIGEIISLTDILDRPNPGALAARTVAALNRIQGRKGQVQPIAAFIGARKQALIIEARQQKHNLAKAYMFLNAMLNSGWGFWQKKDNVNKIINRALHQLQSVWANPYFGTAVNARTSLAIAKKTNQNNNVPLTKKHIRKALDRLEGVE